VLVRHVRDPQLDGLQQRLRRGVGQREEQRADFWMQRVREVRPERLHAQRQIDHFVLGVFRLLQPQRDGVEIGADAVDVEESHGRSFQHG